MQSRRSGKKLKKRKSAFINYDYESTFSEVLHKVGAEPEGEAEKAADDIEEFARIKRRLQEGSLKQVYATKTVRSGKQFEVEIYPEFTRKEAAAGINFKKINRQAQKNLNEKNSRKRAERLINANFSDGDYWITFTYDRDNMPETIEEAQKDMRNFLRRVNHRRKKDGLSPARYIYITEQGEKTGRVHHHLIIDHELPGEQLEKMWNKGRRNNIRRISEDENGLSGLGAYITKQRAKGKKRWCSSKNLKKPVEHKSYTKFRPRRIREMILNHNSIQGILETAYPGKRFLSAEVRYNKENGRYYIYARMIVENRKPPGTSGKTERRKQEEKNDQCKNRQMRRERKEFRQS